MTYRIGGYNPTWFERCYDFEESAFSDGPSSICEKAAKGLLYISSFTVVVPIGLYLVSTCCTDDVDKVERIRIDTLRDGYGATSTSLPLNFRVLENADVIALLCKNKKGLDKKWKQDLLLVKEVIFTSISCEFKTDYGDELTDLVSLFIALSYSEESSSYLSSLEIEESTLTSIFPHDQINLRIHFTNDEYKTPMEFFQEYFQESMSVYFPILERNAAKAQSQLEDIWNGTLLPQDKKAAETFLSNVHLYQSEVPLDSIFCFQKAIELYEENFQDDIYTLIENLQGNEFLLFSLYRVFQFTNSDETDCFNQFVRDVNLVWECRHRLSTPPKINFEKYNEKRINTHLRLCSMVVFYKASQLFLDFEAAIESQSWNHESYFYFLLSQASNKKN